ncbi:hypothetical protein C446_05215 [Halobiforma nitratireducens JCM 10879]|uniref:Uncharacterized protein n=1 Tax=Halobiforma nitratireducens JCM 10879 TaxID=1227454 RepID=M0M8K9_9EURY|nr:hypothetical protein C446_05215 [Halobiforma nitratireducens JCM 10879]
MAGDAVREWAVFLLAILVIVVVLSVFNWGIFQALFSRPASSSGESKTNCSVCGARTTVDSPYCDYCEEPSRPTTR